MYMSKPNTLEELYQFYIKNMPLKPRMHCYRYDYRRKGWNVYTNFIKHTDYEGIILQYYSDNRSYHPDWTLKAYEYIDV